MFGRHHRRGVVAVVAALLAWSLVAPSSAVPSLGVLLVSGALIGVPHGSSDFVVAHRLLASRLSVWWLPTFLVGYLALVGAMLLGWLLAPAATLVGFLAVSAFHFGAGAGTAGHPGESLLRYGARALTPVLPIFLFHPTEVAGVIGLLGGVPDAAVSAMLRSHAMVLESGYAGLLGLTLVMALHRDRGTIGDQTGEAVELVTLAFAAWALPPFMAFAIYFCGLHAVRHMADLGAERYPRNGRAAGMLALAIVVPSALVCCAALVLTWDAVAGWMTDTAVLCFALRLVAALTLPHVLMEFWSEVAATLFSLQVEGDCGRRLGLAAAASHVSKAE